MLQQALAERGIDAITQVWNDPQATWDQFDLVVANGAWDHIHDPEAFLRWADRVDLDTQIVNSPNVLRWNHDKHYLAALASAGVAIVPTTWVEVDADVDQVEFPSTDFVVKPTISGGGFQTARYGKRASEHQAARAHVSELLHAGRSVMVQPYQSGVDVQAEAGLIFLGGRYSHTIRKSALLPPGTRASAGLYNEAVITASEPIPEQLRAAEHALGVAERLSGPSTYARVDLVPNDLGAPALLELELLDPALFFDHHPPAAVSFAHVLASLMPAG